MRTDNLGDSIITKIIRRLEKLESSGMLNSASITYGRLRLIGGELLGQAGAALNWIGSATFNGPFSNTGTFTNTGPFNNSGVFTNTGPFNNSGKLTNNGELEQNGNSTLNGDVKITENLDVTADTLLRALTKVLADLRIEGGGKIQAGVVVIDGTDGGRIAAPGATLSLVANEVTTTGGFRATNNALVEGNLTVLGNTILTLNTTSNPANVYYDEASGQLRYNP